VSNSTDSTVMLGGRDGYMRQWKQNQLTDDGTAFDSYVDIGPLFAGNPGFDEGVFSQITGTLAKDSADLAWEIRSGSSPEEAFNGPIKYRGVWTADNLNPTHYPRVRGADFYLRLKNVETGRKWALERLIIEMERHGRISL